HPLSTLFPYTTLFRSQVEQLAKGDREAVKILLESLLLSGLAMSFAGITRPASGVEHYFSHVWEMRHLEFGTPQDFHGLQCGIGTDRKSTRLNSSHVKI